MHRRAFLGAFLGAIAAPALARRARAADARPTLVYLSAEDCPTCRYWEKRFKSKFEASAESRAVDFRTVMVHSLTDLREKARWPADLEWLRVQVPEQATPRFFLVRDKRIVVRGDGIDGWNDVIVPRLKKLAAEG
jgi:hypothetical protein